MRVMLNSVLVLNDTQTSITVGAKLNLDFPRKETWRNCLRMPYLLSALQINDPG